jgi:toxin ParE1/3/4
MKILWTRRAVTELGMVADHIRGHNPAAARALHDHIRSTVNRLKEFPHSGRPGRVAETRELVVPGANYIVPYRVREDRLEILAIFHAAREWPDGF